MKKWFKYSLVPEKTGTLLYGMDEGFSDHKKSMGEYDTDDAYESKEKFFNKYFWGYHGGRLENYDAFIRKHLRKEELIFSVASGRCANELYLMESGYKNIIGSDLGIPECFESMKNLFPDFRFVGLDVLKEPLPGKYDVVLCLSLIYLFDDVNLSKFFETVSLGLKSGGQLILDSAGSPDNVFASLFHDGFLKTELLALKLYKYLFKRKTSALIIKHHGFRRTDKEIIQMAAKHGFEFCDKASYAFLTEFDRSPLLRGLMRYGILRPLFSLMGRMIPYSRMFKFKKIK